MKILILCTGNSCRSQMAHGFLQSFDKNMDVFSAGTKPAEKVNPMAVKVMSETGPYQPYPQKRKPVFRARMGLCDNGMWWRK